MLQGILIVVAFLVVAALMMTKKIPTLLALPLMAVVICIIAGVPMFGKNADGAEIGWLTTVFEAGTVRMGSAIMATIFGAWLGQLMNKTGVTENIIKKSAELGGDRPLVVTLIMVVATAVLFTTLSGLGSIIMVGSIVLPILISVGVPAASAACIFLMAFTARLSRSCRSRGHRPLLPPRPSAWTTRRTRTGWWRSAVKWACLPQRPMRSPSCTA